MSRIPKSVRVGATLAVCTAVVLMAMLWLSGVFRSGQIEPAKLPLPPEPVVGSTAAVELVRRPDEADVVGSVQSELRTTISSRLVATITEITVRASDKVKRGDVLVRLDDRDVKARVEQARGSLHAAEATRDLAKLEVDRLTPMVQQKVASPYELDQWKSKYDAAAADVLRAQQAIKEAEVALSDTQITASFDGVVIDRQAEPGDMAAPGKPLLTIYDPTNLRLEASLRESYIGHLKVGQQIAVLIDSIKQQRTGTVQEIVPAADPGSRSFLVKVHLPDAMGLYPGMFARMRVPLEEQEQLVIPAAAVDRIGQLNLVTVVSEDGGRPQRRSIRLGHESAGQVQVLAGLSQGERIVVK